jgi:hypothetical protein
MFRLLRAFRSIKDRAARRRLVDAVEAMTEGHTADKALDDKAGKPRA